MEDTEITIKANGYYEFKTFRALETGDADDY